MTSPFLSSKTVGRSDVPQIATFTGHSLNGVEAIVDAHDLSRDVRLAEAAVMKLEARTKPQTVSFATVQQARK